MSEPLYTIGVDLGGTKIEVALVNASGTILHQMRLSTNVKGGPEAIEDQIAQAIRDLKNTAKVSIIGVGIGVAGQVDAAHGLVHFAPNLNWHRIPLRHDLGKALGLPIMVINDVRGAAWGEWFYGAGQGCNDLVCVFVGTGIGGGIISGGHMLMGCTNTVGEIGHMTIDLNGPLCTCNNRGCLEALAGGWAIAKRAQEATSNDRKAGAHLLELAGGHLESIEAKTVFQASQNGDTLANSITEEVTHALIVGATNIVNAFNPCRLILGGGCIEGLPDILQRIDQGVRQRALSAATASLQILLSKLHHNAGVVGAAAFAMQAFAKL